MPSEAWLARHGAFGLSADAGRATVEAPEVRRLDATIGFPGPVLALRVDVVGRSVGTALAEAHGTCGVPRYLDGSAAQPLLRTQAALQ